MTVILYLITGLCAGFLAGLLGVGGGLIIVPALVFIFAAQQLAPDALMHLALGTSLASIVFTSLASLRAHHRHGAVDWNIVKAITPGILAGTLLGAMFAARLDTAALKLFFIAFLFYAATQMLFDWRPQMTRPLPGKIGMTGAGSVIGAISSFAGIGGGTLSVPFLTWCGVALHRAIGTSAAIGFPIAVAGAVGYIAGGFSAKDLPNYSLGYVYFPALLPLVIASTVTAPFGARLAHRLPVNKLKRVFALLLYALALRMSASLL